MGSSIKDVRKWGEGGSNLFSKVYIGQRGEGVKYWQNFADVLYGWPLWKNFKDRLRTLEVPM